MKKTSSFNLEQDIWDEIINYKDKYNLSSRNIALERMLLERRMLMTINSKEDHTPIEKDTETISNKKDSVLESSLTNSYNNMPD
jgi:hypothetical protein